jgi:hypothetical protein
MAIPSGAPHDPASRLTRRLGADAIGELDELFDDHDLGDVLGKRGLELFRPAERGSDPGVRGS